MRNIALLPSYLSVLLYLGGVFLLFVVAGSGSRWTGLIVYEFLLLFLTLWLQDAFLIAEESRPAETRRSKLGWLPFAPPLLIGPSVIMAVAVPALAPLATGVGSAGLLLYFVLIYRAAVALVRAEGKVTEGVPFFNAASLAWLALFYFPIGVWFVRPRLERLNSRARAVAAA